jgi:hypothetical protein
VHLYTFAQSATKKASSLISLIPFLQNSFEFYEGGINATHKADSLRKLKIKAKESNPGEGEWNAQQG